MRIQFTTVPDSDNTLMCVSEIESRQTPSELLDAFAGIKEKLGLSAVFITNEVVRLGPTPPETVEAPDLPAEETLFECPRSGYYGPFTGFSQHGPCNYVACCLTHCRCEHTAEPCGQGCLRAEDCNHA